MSYEHEGWFKPGDWVYNTGCHRGNRGKNYGLVTRIVTELGEPTPGADFCQVFWTGTGILGVIPRDGSTNYGSSAVISLNPALAPMREDRIVKVDAVVFEP